MLTIYHNPKCSKSRATLALLEERGLKLKIIRYLESPPSKGELKHVLKALAMGPRDLLRKGENLYADLGLASPELSNAALIGAMVENPILIERPIVVNGDKAVIGRPPEAVLKIL